MTTPTDPSPPPARDRPRDLLQRGTVAHLQKPFQLTELQQAIQELTGAG